MDAEYRLEVRAVYPDANVADVSNIAKAIEDGCEGVLWDNDRAIVELVAKRQVDREAEGRVDVVVEVVGGSG